MTTTSFNLREEILREHSKTHCLNMVAWIGANQHRFNELLQLVLSDEYRVAQRASWPLSELAIVHPELFHSSLEVLIDTLERRELHNAVRRHTMRILETVVIPVKLQGKVMKLCFEFVESPSEAVAVKAYALTILGKLAIAYPDIIPEIQLLIEEQLPTQTPAFKSRAKHLLKAFTRSKNSLVQNAHR
jgi:hypothetical protein